MRTSILISWVVLGGLGCAREASTGAAQPGLVPVPDERAQLLVLPGDLASWLQTDPPRLTVQLHGLADGRAEELVKALAASARIITGKGEPVAVEVVSFGVPEERLPGSQTPSPAGIQLRPTAGVGPGWHRLELDVGKLPVETTPDDVVRDGVLSARFNLASAPTVRRLWVCPALGQVRVQFSEPIEMGPGAEVVGLSAEDGAEVGCSKGLERARLDSAGELLAVQCDEKLPSVLRVKLAEWGFVSPASKRPVLGLDGKPVDWLLSLEKLPSAQVGEADCRVYVP